MQVSNNKIVLQTTSSVGAPSAGKVALFIGTDNSINIQTPTGITEISNFVDIPT